MNQGGLGFKRDIATGGIPVWQGIAKDIQLVQGGFLLDQTGIATDEIVPAGSPVVFNETNRTATVLRTGVVTAVAGGTATTYQVSKGNLLNVGDNIAIGAVGGKAYAITAIDTSNADYDSLTVGTSIGAAAVGDLIYVSTATGATASALPAINGRLYDAVFGKTTGVSISVVVRGTVYARRVPNNAAIEAALKANGAYIIHSQSL